jgi:hypothetical protein
VLWYSSKVSIFTAKSNIMKKILLLLVTFISIHFSHAQTADDVINKHIAAIGGKEAWAKLNSMIMTGNLKVQGTDIQMKFTVLNRKGLRQDITAMGMSGYTILTPTAGWQFMPFQGQKQAEPMTADDIKEGQSDLDIEGNLINYKDKGHTVEYLGTDDVDGIDAYKIKETLKSGKVETVYIDPKTYYIMKVVSKQKANGREMDVTNEFSNYQKLPEGIVVPMGIKSNFGDLAINKVEVNSVIDEAIFKPGK